MSAARHVLPVLVMIVATPVQDAHAETDLNEIIALWARKQGWSPPRRDAALERVARANSVALDEVSGMPPRGASAYLQFLLERESITDAVVQGVVLERTHAPVGLQVEERLRESATGPFTHVGIGRAGRMITVVLSRRLVQVQTRTSPHGTIRLCVLPRVSIHKPLLLVTSPSGIVHEKRWSGSRRQACFTLPGTQRGRYQVEVVVEGRFGPEVAALFPLFVGMEPPPRPSYKLYPDGKQEHVEIRVMHLVNRARRSRGLSPLQPSRLLARAARNHSQDMLVAGYFGHVSPTRGNLARRLAAAEVRYSQASENLAMATDPNRAFDGLMASPIHRRTLLDPQATHIGVGVASDLAKGLLYVTQILARF